MTTTTIQDTIVKLDGLHIAYKELLEQATKQLEEVELTPEIVRSLTEQLKDDNNFTASAGRAAANYIKEDIKAEESVILDTYAGKNLCNAVADRMFEAVKGRIDAYIKEKVELVVDSNYIERKLEQKVLENGAIDEALVLRRKLNELLDALARVEAKHSN